MKGSHSRMFRDSVRSAGLRRWDGKARMTTDWINLFHVSRIYAPIDPNVDHVFRSLNCAGLPETVWSTFESLVKQVGLLLFVSIQTF